MRSKWKMFMQCGFYGGSLFVGLDAAMALWNGHKEDALGGVLVAILFALWALQYKEPSQ